MVHHTRPPVGEFCDALPRPRLSIIVPLGDSRQDAVENIRCWTEMQTRFGQDYQIIAVADGASPEMETAIAKVLRPWDTLIRCPTSEHVLSRLARGARCAEAYLLFFAEHHCTPDATCVDAVIRFFDTSPHNSAAVLRMKQRFGGPDGHLHQRWFAAVEDDWLRSGDWIRLRAGAFAMRKDVYFDLGAHDGRYGLFADEILGARANHAGVVVGRVVDSAVNHITATMTDHQHHVKDFTLGECLYRAAHEEAFCERYFGYAHIWANRLAFNTSLARSTVLILTKMLITDVLALRTKNSFRRLRNTKRELISRLAVSLFGPKPFTYVAKAALKWSELRTTRLSRADAARWHHFCVSWQRMISYERMVCAIRWSGIVTTDSTTPDFWAVCDISDTLRLGFHGIELRRGKCFRWSEPLFMLQIARKVGPTRVTVATASEHVSPQCVQAVWWAGRPVQQFTIDSVGIHFCINITSPSPSWLVILVERFRSPGDTRRLGIPIFSLSFAPM
jgi:hypothetical protein